MGSTGKKIGYLVVIVFVCLAAVVLMAAAMGTDFWITAYDETTNITYPITNYKVDMNMGLFKGFASIVCTAPPADGSFSVKEYKDVEGFLNFGLWVATILFVALGILFTVITAIFSLVNSFTTPIEEITGITGLYLWNNLAGFFSLMGILMFVGEYFSNFRNILYVLREQPPFNSIVLSYQHFEDNQAEFGYSFYLVVGSAGLLIINNIFIFLTTYKVDTKKQLPRDMDQYEETVDGNIMLY